MLRAGTSKASRLSKRYGIVSDILYVLRKKSAIAGIAIILFFVVIGGLADFIATNDPRAQRLADEFAVPEWVTDPATPRNIEKMFESFEVVKSIADPGVSVEVVSLSGGVKIRIGGVGSANIVIRSPDYLYYPYEPARSMLITSAIEVRNTSPTMPWYDVQLIIENVDLASRKAVYELRMPDGSVKPIPRGIYVVSDLAKERIGWIYPLINTRYVPKRTISVMLPNPLVNYIQPYFDESLRGVIEAVSATQDILLERDTRLTATVNITYYCNPQDLMMRCSPGSGVEIVLEPVKVRIFGRAFGILGTDFMGRDVWAQFVYGSRSAIVLGLSVASVIILIGLVIGLIAGYVYGSLLDNIITFIIDTIYFLPLLPIIMAIGMVYGRSLFIIYAALIALAWPGTARVIRHWTVAMKEAPFIEAARALGASTSRILFRHVAPQLIPYLIYSIVMSVPGVVMFEAGIQLIGFGDPTAPTWGRMIGEAYNQGGFLQNAWWWFMPPIIGLIAISIGFILIGMALDEIVNPRLRRR
jgi:ABC-type dipeptide/oligopeptide/nickel transport system permease subunit